MRMRAIVLGAIASLCAIGSLATVTVPARAEGLGVMDRPRPDYDAIGLPVGSFRLYPTLDLGVNSDDNIYRTQTGTVSDVFFTIAPAIDLKSQWSRHLLEIVAGLQDYQYSSHSDESLADWYAGANGRLDIQRGSAVFANGSYNKLHEGRSSPNSPGFIKEPVRYTQGHFDGSVSIQPNRLGIAVGGSLDRYDYDNTPLLGGGFLNNQDRNRDEYQGFAKVFYDFRSGYSAFIKATYDDRSFDKKIDRTGVDRTSHGYRVDGGLDLYLTHLLRGEVFAGYLTQDFKAPLKNVSGFDYGVNLDWYASQVLTFHLTASRTPNDTTLLGASTSDDRSVGGGLDYEFRRNIILQASGSYTDSKFTGITRDDQTTGAHVGLKYLLNRYMSATAAYDYQQRDSNLGGQNFTDNTFGVTLHLQM